MFSLVTRTKGGNYVQYKEVETFLELFRTRNITRTAELMYVSQSTVSNRLKSLENELGCQLIVRTRGHRVVQLTRQGEEFIQIAERWKELFDETERLKASSLSALRIATGESTYYTWIAPFSAQFLRRTPRRQGDGAHMRQRTGLLAGGAQPGGSGLCQL